MPGDKVRSLWIPRKGEHVSPLGFVARREDGETWTLRRKSGEFLGRFGYLRNAKREAERIFLDDFGRRP